MMRILPHLGATSALGAALVATAMAPSHISHAQGTSNTPVVAGLLSPRSGSMAAGSAAIISASMLPAGTTGSGNNGGAGSAGSNASGGGVTFALQVSGLKPSATYRVDISSQACSGGSRNGSAVSSIPSVRADAMGDAMAITPFKNMGALVRGMTNPQAAGLQVALSPAVGNGAPVVCSSLHAPNRIIRLSASHSRVQGLALLTAKVPVLSGAVKSGTEVIVYATGLRPNTVSPNHIHAGPCNTPSPVLFPLLTLVANGSGSAVAGTGIPYLVNLSSGSLHIHNADFSLAACGNLQGSGTMPASSTSGSSGA